MRKRKRTIQLEGYTASQEGFNILVNPYDQLKQRSYWVAWREGFKASEWKS